MPTLEWIGKKAVLNHHREIPFHLLSPNSDLSAGDSEVGNLLVQGDNLTALKALLPYYAQQVKLIYIDPPYNTGNEGWIYNDAVNSSEMREWLGKVVGDETDDLSRHDKWLNMMYPRLQLLKQFLRRDGVICVSIDDNEIHHLRALMDEVFGPRSWMATLAWKRRLTPDSRNVNGVSVDVEYIVCYGRSGDARFQGQVKDMSKYTNPDNDPRGAWMSDNLTGLANATERPNLHYDVINPSTGRKYPPHSSRGWIYGRERMLRLIEEGRILWPAKPTGRPRLKRFISDMKSETTGFSTLLDAPANVAGTKELAAILGTKTFAFPKPVELIRQLVEQVTRGDDIILDSFAGSGTTGQAVLEQNQRDGGNRRFVLVELDETIARQVTAERLRQIVVGYRISSSSEGVDAVAALGSGYRYCELGPSLCDDSGGIRQSVTFAQLAQHVFFTETGVPMPKRARGKSPLLGVHEGKAIYLLYNGILRDHRPDGGNVLTQAILKELPAHLGPKVIFGEGCRLGAGRLDRERISFKQTPYDVDVG